MMKHRKKGDKIGDFFIDEITPKQAPYRRKYLVVKQPTVESTSHQKYSLWVYHNKYLKLNPEKPLIFKHANLLLQSIYRDCQNPDETYFSYRQIQNALSLEEGLRSMEHSEELIRAILDILQVLQVLKQSGLMGYVREQYLVFDMQSKTLYVSDINFNKPQYSYKVFSQYITEVIYRLFFSERIPQLQQAVNQEKFLNLQNRSLSYTIQDQKFIWECVLAKSSQKYQLIIEVSSTKSQILLGSFCFQNSQVLKDMNPVKIFILFASEEIRNLAELSPRQYLIIKNGEKKELIKLENKKEVSPLIQQQKPIDYELEFLNHPQLVLSGQQPRQIIERARQIKNTDPEIALKKELQEKQRVNQDFSKGRKLTKDELKSKEFPFNCVGRIYSNMYEVTYSEELKQQNPKKLTILGTGTLISPWIVLTCAHNCIKYHQHESISSFIKVMEKRDISFVLNSQDQETNGSLQSMKYRKKYVVRDFKYCQKYKQYSSVNSSYDFALLFLDQPVSHITQFIDIAKDYSELQEPIYMKGFYQMLIFNLNDKQLPKKGKIETRIQVGETMKYDQVQNSLLHNAWTVSGYSGGPILVDFTRQHFFIIGIHIRAERQKISQKPLEAKENQLKMKQEKAVKMGVYFTNEVISQFQEMQRYFIAKYGQQMAQHGKTKIENLRVFKHVIKYKNIYIPKVDQYKQCFNEIAKDKEKYISEINAYLPMTFLLNSDFKKGWRVVEHNSIAIVNGLIKILDYQEQRFRFVDISGGTFSILAYLLNHIRIIWEAIIPPKNKADQFQKFVKNIKQTKKTIFSQKNEVTEGLKRRTLQIFEESQKWVCEIQAHPALIQILKMIGIFCNELGKLFKVRKYKLYATQLCVAALIAYKIFKAIQSIVFQSVSKLIQTAVEVVKEIFWLCREYDIDVFKSTILSVVKYIGANSDSAQEKKDLRQLACLLDGQFQRVNHNPKFDKRFTPILEFLKKNKSSIFVEREDK